MPLDATHLYEGLFLFPQSAAAELAPAVEHIKTILERHHAQILVLRKWDERKLAFPIKGQKRGVYLLAYFNIAASQVAGIDRDCNLSEQILRSLLIKADHVGEVELELAKREVPAAVEARMRGSEDRPRTGPAAPDALGEEQIPSVFEAAEETER